MFPARTSGRPSSSALAIASSAVIGAAAISHAGSALCARESAVLAMCFVCLLSVGLTRTRVPTATPEDDRGEKAEPRRYALLTLIRQALGD